MFSRRAIENAVANRDAVRLFPAVLSGTTQRHKPRVRAEALLLWNSHMWISGMLALALHEPQLPPRGVDHVVSMRGAHVRTPARVHAKQVLRIPGGSVQGLDRVVTPAFAVVDAWNRTPTSRRVDGLYRALWSGVTTAQDISQELALCPRVADRGTIQRIVYWCIEGAMSPLEVMGHRDVFFGQEWRCWSRQLPLEVNGHRCVADMAHEASRTIIEFDGQEFHGTRIAQARDAQRDVVLASAGWITLRFQWGQLRSRPEWCRAQVRNVLAMRARRPR